MEERAQVGQSSRDCRQSLGWVFRRRHIALPCGRGAATRLNRA